MLSKQLNDLEGQRDSEAATLAPQNEKQSVDNDKQAMTEKEETTSDDVERRGSNKGKVSVTLDPNEDPKNFPLARKWLIVLVMSSAALCATCTSSIVSCNFTVV